MTVSPPFRAPLLFLSTPSARRATFLRFGGIPQHINFYPRPPRGGRPHRSEGNLYGRVDFYPRPPRGGRRHLAHRNGQLDYFYPRPPRGGRLHQEGAGSGRCTISIHALREEGDGPLTCAFDISSQFLSTPSARRATVAEASAVREEILFLSTPSARRATAHLRCSYYRQWYFYPRPPRGGRPQSCTLNLPCYENFYPRPPRGGRRFRRVCVRCPRLFLSTPSARRAT